MKYFSIKIIDKNQLLNNFQNLKQFSNKKICAVVKANAYGHNAISVCKILSECCDFFAVQNINEALDIRKVNKKAKILVLGYCIDYKKAIKNNIDVTVDCVEELNKIIKLKSKINIHLKINTGMNRLGIKSIDLLKDIIFLIKNNKNVNFEGVYTHFFNSSDKKITEKQIKIFKKYLKEINKEYTPLVHIGGSGMINYKNLDFVDYIRCGLALYGYGCDITKPVMKIKSKLIKITKVRKGEYVGYDGFYRCEKDIVIGLIPIGYADGIIRQFQQNMNVFFNGQNIKVVGKICMDMLMIDITNIKININDYVEVFNDAKYWAKNSRLSEYEILTGLNNARTDLLIY